MRQYVLEEGNVRLHAADAELAQRAQHLADCEGKGIGVGDDLEEQRVIERRYAGARIAIAGIQTDSESGARAPGIDTAGIGQEVVGGVLGGDAALHGEPTWAHHLLRADADLRRRQLVSFADAQLRLHQIDARDLLGDGVLDLQARVDFDEIMARSIDEEFHRAGARISRGFRQLQRVGADPVTQFTVDVRRGRDLDDFLMAPLHGAIALEQVDHVAVLVAQDLHLDVPHLGQPFLDEDGLAAEGELRFAAGAFERLLELDGLRDDAHAAAAAAVGGLDQGGAVLGHEGACGADLLLGRAAKLDAWNHGDPGLQRQALGRHFVAHQRDHLGAGPDEAQATLLAGARELRVLGEEAIARMDGVGAALPGHVQDLLDAQVGVDGPLAAPDQVRLVRLVAMLRDAVLLAVDADGADAELVARAEDADRDLAAVRAQHLAKRDDGHARHARSRCEDPGGELQPRTPRASGVCAAPSYLTARDPGRF